MKTAQRSAFLAGLALLGLGTSFAEDISFKKKADRERERKHAVETGTARKSSSSRASS